MSGTDATTTQNGCHNEKGPLSVPAPPSESQSAAKIIPNLDQSPSDLSSPKKAIEVNGDAQSSTTSKVVDKTEIPIAGPGSDSHSISSDNRTASAGVVPPASTAVAESAKQEKIPNSAKLSENTPESVDAVDKGKEKKPSKAKKDKREAKSSKRKSPETSKSKNKKSRESSAMDGVDAVPSEKVNGRSGAKGVKEKRDRKRKQSESSEADQEPRTGKRVRLPHMPFQHPAAQQIPQFYKNSFASQKHSSKESADDKIVVFSRGDFLAVRNDSDSFYICRTTQNVYKTSRKFKIQWLQNEKNKDIYQLDFLDQTDFECVLTNLRLNRRSKGVYELPPDEKQRVLNILQRAINVERGVTDVPDLKQVAADGIDVSVVGKKEEKELLELEAHAKKEAPPVESSKTKVLPAEAAAKGGTRARKMSTESSRSSRKSETSQKENAKKRDGKASVDQKKEVRSEKKKEKKQKELPVKPVVKAKSNKLREKRSSSVSSSNVQSASAKSKDQVLVEKIVDEIVKKHKIKRDEKEKKKKKPKEGKEVRKEELHRSSRLTRNTSLPPTSSPLIKPPPPHHETIRGLVNLLNSFSSSSLRSSTLLLLERLASDYPKDCLPFLVETLLTGHRAFLENDDSFVAGPYFPRRHAKESPPKSKAPRSLFQMYFHPKMLAAKFGTDKEYDRNVVEYYASYYSFIVSVCKIGIRSDFVSGDLVSLCSTVALESLSTGVPVFVSFWRELVDAEEKGQESQFLEVLGHCPNFRNYIIAILNQERKFLAHDSNFELAKSLAPKVKTMSSLTQKLVSSRSMTLIGDISKDYPSVEAVKDLHVFSTVLRALNLSLLYESKTISSDKFKSIIQGLKDKFGRNSCNGDSTPDGSPHKEVASGDCVGKTNGNLKSKSHETRTDDMTNKINDCMNSILLLLDASK